MAELTFKDLIGHLPDTYYGVSPDSRRKIQQDTFKVICQRYGNHLQDRVVEDLKKDQKFRAECVRDLEKEVFEKMKEDPDILKQLRAETRDKLEKEETKKLRLEIDADVRKELAPKYRKEIRKEFMDELSKQHPNVQERANFVELLHDSEVECLALGDTTMRRADNLDGWVGYRKFFNSFMMTAIPAIVLSAIGASGWYLQTMMDPDRWVSFGIVSVILFIAAVFGTYNFTLKIEDFKRNIERMRTDASAYLTLAGDIKRHRMMTAVSAESKQELSKAIDDVYRRKAGIDERVHPDPDKLQQARVRVKSDMLNDYDPMKTLRVEEIKDFDERLADAEAAHEREILAEEEEKKVLDATV